MCVLISRSLSKNLQSETPIVQSVSVPVPMSTNSSADADSIMETEISAGSVNNSSNSPNVSAMDTSDSSKLVNKPVKREQTEEIVLALSDSARSRLRSIMNSLLQVPLSLPPCFFRCFESDIEACTVNIQGMYSHCS